MLLTYLQNSQGNSRETPAFESLFDKVAGQQPVQAKSSFSTSQALSPHPSYKTIGLPSFLLTLPLEIKKNKCY